jgi:hypothetical protein
MGPSDFQLLLLHTMCYAPIACIGPPSWPTRLNYADSVFGRHRAPSRRRRLLLPGALRDAPTPLYSGRRCRREPRPPGSASGHRSTLWAGRDVYPPTPGHATRRRPGTRPCTGLAGTVIVRFSALRRYAAGAGMRLQSAKCGPGGTQNLERRQAEQDSSSVLSAPGHGQPAHAQNSWTTSSSTSAHCRTLCRSAHSLTAWAPAPPGPKTTHGMPAAPIRAASIQ